MLRYPGHKILRQLWSQTNKPYAVLNGIHSSSGEVCHLAKEPDGVINSKCVPDQKRSGGWRQYSTSSRGLTSYGALQLGLAEPVPVQLPSDIVPEDLVLNLAQRLKVKPRLDARTLKFGAEYTDHMLQISWKAGFGWEAPSIDPLGPIPIHPCAQVLHYAMECFEGMKAFKTKDGRIQLFRPEMNMNRLARSASRVGLPAFDKEALLECIKALLRVERDWIPEVEGFSLYMRPTIISTHPHLGMGPSSSAAFFCVLSPVGPYYPDGLQSIRLMVEKKHVRAFPGGLGDAKVGGNYAPTVVPQTKAQELGCQQVLYVLDDGYQGGAVGESGAMNVFFLLRKHDGQLELVTPHLDGVILPGVTRDSVLALTRSFGGIQVSERRLSWDEIEEADRNGNIVEVFGTGTAVIIQPIVGLVMEDRREIHIPFDARAASHWTEKPVGTSLEVPKADEPFSLSGRLTRAILDIQYGHVHSNWSMPIEE
ncbi:unnamed protein product [Calypogeia fissa]